ncbi:GNAT family N-acetyltransferase [Alphaproteobacteria bacterium]|nr:GNAT family N-acetyltransferase [Alphaproteobacteria bacterium]
MAKDTAVGDITLEWDQASLRDWDRLISAMPQSPLEQSWAYGLAMAQTTPFNVHTLIARQNCKVIAFSLVYSWRLAGTVTVTKIIRGPLFPNPIDALTRSRLYAEIKAAFPLHKLNFFTWMPEQVSSPEATKFMADVSMRQVITGYSTIWLNLAQSPDVLRSQLDGKWRNQLKKAEAATFKTRISEKGMDLEWLLQKHDEHRKNKQLRAPAGDFVRAVIRHCQGKQHVMVLAAQKRRSNHAAILLLRHGRTATYYIGYSDEIGRRNYLHNLLLWRGIEKLVADGVQWLDLGGIDGQRMPGVSRFKLGLGGTPTTLAGTYL